MSRTIIYQLLPRLFGNSTKDCIANGTIEQNGCGKFRTGRSRISVIQVIDLVNSEYLHQTLAESIPTLPAEYRRSLFQLCYCQKGHILNLLFHKPYEFRYSAGVIPVCCQMIYRNSFLVSGY